jgi:hypothetical protein
MVSLSRELIITSVAASSTDRLPFLSGDRTPGIYEDVRTSINAATPLFSFSPENTEERRPPGTFRETRRFLRELTGA